MAKIAVIGEGCAAGLRQRPLARGDGWAVSDVICTLGPRDPPFEEQHSSMSIAIVAAGTFQYRSHAGRALMTPGSLMLVTAGQCFECGHEHGKGDRCISFSYSREFFDRLEVSPSFRALRLPPLRDLSLLIARASAALGGTAGISWEELGLELAARTIELDRGLPREQGAAPAAIARVARVVRSIDENPDGTFELTALARQAQLSPYHFLRTFRSVAGVTPHQHLLRRRLQRAAIRLKNEPAKIVDIALDCGFGDVSNFNRAFRAEFGLNPRAWRRFGSP